jgi:hypothetical protein
MGKSKIFNKEREAMKHAVLQLIEPIFGVIIFKDTSLVVGCSVT